MRTDLQGLRFIIVAGDYIASTDLQNSLERRGATVTVALTCASAFEAIEQNRPDLAVLDWGMSDCNAVADELNALDIPHLYVGTPAKNARSSVREHFSAAFADAVLTLINEDEPDGLVPTA